jgi:NAD(P)-dependent dehydrogenase (short-subunit alcohol dehydrogenase family)
MSMATAASLDGRTVLITGAARGIGAETARALAARGANVMLVGLEPPRLEALAKQLGAERTAWAEADVVDAAALAAAVDATISRFGGLDVAIANAGVHFAGAIATAPIDRLERELLVNLHGTLITDRAVLPALIRSRGYLLNVASLAASSHLPLMGTYAASKAGVEALTNCLRAEVAHTGVAVGCAYLGFFDTDLTRGSMADRPSELLMRGMPQLLARPRPLPAAIDAIVDGVVRRKRRVWAPRYVGAALALRGLLQPAADHWAQRSPLVAAATQLADANRASAVGDELLLGVAAPARSDQPDAVGEPATAAATTA